MASYTSHAWTRATEVGFHRAQVLSHLARLLVFLLVATVTAGCRNDAGREPAQVELRWGEEGRFEPYQATRLILPPGRPALYFLLHPPPLDDPNPGVLVPEDRDVSATQGGEPLRRGRLPIFAMRDGSQPVLVRYALDRSKSAPFRARFGGDLELADGMVRAGIGDLVVCAVLLGLGVGLMLLGVMRVYARAYAWLGLFAFAVGWLNIAASDIRSLFIPSYPFWSYAISISIFTYVTAFGRFIDGAIAGGDRPLRWASNLTALALALGIAANLLGLFPLAALRSYAYYTALAGIFWVGRLIVPRAYRGEETARNLLASVTVLLAFGVPDILGAVGVSALAWRTAPYAVVAFILLLTPLIERGYERQRKALAEAHTALQARVTELTEQEGEIRSLNVELRHQIADRSRQLAELLMRGAMSPAALEPGQVLAGRYRLVRRLGAGGMGEVYECERTADGKRLALKVMLKVSDASDAARFAREAELAARLDHPHIVTIFDAGVDEGRLYLVMELVAGKGLDEHASRYGDVPWALRVLGQIASGLEALHARQIVHRDLKPANVLLATAADGAEVAKISDFGIARASVPGDSLEHARTEVGPSRRALVAALDTATDARADTVAVTPDALGRTEAAAAEPRRRSDRLTATGGLVGTPLYMPPEALDRGRDVDAAGDVYAFGVIAFELLERKLPFATPPVLLGLTGGTLAAPMPMETPGVDDAIRALVTSCLAVSPSERPTAEVIAAALAPAAKRAAP